LAKDTHLKRIFIVLLIFAFILNDGCPTVKGQQPAISIDRVRDDIALLSSLESRFTGYPGSYEAGGIIAERFRSLGLQVRLVNYTLTVPYDGGSSLKVGGRTIKAHSLYPNSIATGEVRASGKLVYLGHGTPRELNGRDIRGNIVLLEFNSGSAWITAVKLGASAVVFLEDGATTRFEAMAKVSSAPLTTPRLYVMGPEAEELRELSRLSPSTEILNGMRWKEVTGTNIVGEIKGAEDPSKVIIITAHYDSASIVPAISPGADDAVSVANLLEFIRSLKEQGFSPKYTVWFIATSGHWQALSGAREFVEKTYFDPSIGNRIFPYLVIDLELTSGTPHLNLVYSGLFYSIMSNWGYRRLDNIQRLIRDSLGSFQKSYPGSWAKIGTIPLAGLTGLGYDPANPGYRQGIGFRNMMDMEPFQLANSIALGVVSYDDMRLRFFTPSDTVDFVETENIFPQSQFLGHILLDILKAPIDGIYSGGWDPIKPSRLGETYSGVGFATLYVNALEYDPTNPSLYNPVPNALVFTGNPLDPFSLIVTRANATGWAEFHGPAPPVMGSGQAPILPISSYMIDQEGRIMYAPDKGTRGSVYPSMINIMGHPTTARTAIVKCGTATVFDITSSDTLQAASSPNSLYEVTNAYSLNLRSYGGYEAPIALGVSVMRMPGYAPLESWGFDFDAVQSIAQIYAPPGTRFGFMLKSTSLTRTIAIYANVTLENQDGYGYLIGKEGDRLLIDGTLTGMLREPLTLAYGRYVAQRDIQVIDPTTREQLKLAAEFNSTLSDEIQRLDYEASLTDSLLAWGLSVKAYEYSLGVLRDSVTSIVMTFALAIPFVLLFVALIYGLTRGLRSVSITAAIAIVVATIPALFHPGFRLAANIPAVFMGTLVLALVIPVLFLLFVNFSSSLSELRKELLGAHFLGRSGFEVSFSAVTIGVSNLQKRKFRTALTLAGIVFVSFALTSLTSVTEIKVLQVTPESTDVRYNGITLRTSNFAPLEKDFMTFASIYLTNKSEFAARYWVYMPSIAREGAAGFIVVTSASSTAEINVLAGISPLELKASFVDFDKFKVKGSMFKQNDTFSAIIPSGLASNLKVDIGDSILMNGFRLRIAAILNTTAMLTYVKDSDNPRGDVMPMDTFMLSSLRVPPSYEYAFSASSVIFVPARLVELIPEASLTSVFVPAEGVPFDELYVKAGKLFSAFNGLNVYLTYNGTRYTFSKKNETTLFGFQFVVIPMILAGLITMSTILGGAMERLKEGYIYSSLGLAPLQVGLMFLGENIVYAIVGSMIGYLSGLSASYLLRTLGIIELTVNYTSSFVTVAIGSVIVMVLLASLYPLYRISILVTPSLERRWRLPTKPKGDLWDIPIPFRIKDDERAGGIAAFMREYLWNKRIERAGVFSVESVIASRTESTWNIKARVWLAPYEQDIRQEMNLTITKSKTEQRHLVSLNLQRVSGPYDSWVRFNYPFVDEVRKQMLVWSLLSPEDEKGYIQTARDQDLLG